MARVLLENVTLEKGILCPVHSLTLEVRDKEFVSLLAPSGSGKTTTLRIVAGLDRPEKGSVWIGDEEVGDMTPAERDVAMIFQTYALYPHVSVRDNLASPLKVRKTPETEID
ncbi:MAG: ATP-binding cassette domain-containing protein, partial [Aigarchaeota archaeon]|nr:ATP-binding cassette domain-containing protein [Aigarchaeota archaeon]